MQVTRGVMIDGPETADRDDAVWVARDGAGWSLTVHIADVAAVVPLGGAVDAGARRMITTRYLPEGGHVPMIGAGEARATLREGVAQPTLRVTVAFDADGEAVASDVARGVLSEGAARTYPQAAAALRDPDDPLHTMLTHAHELSRVLLSRRRAAGALAFYDLLQGFATTEEGNLVRLGGALRNAGYMIVQELMIAANEAVALWVAEHDVPILFRNHRASAVAPSRDELLEDLSSFAAETGNRVLVEKRLAMLMRPATYAPTVTGHYALNLPAYTHATSPLRRYPDLVTQRMLFAAADGAPPPYSLDQLTEMAEGINATIRQRRQATSDRHRDQARRQTRRVLDTAPLAQVDSDTFHRVVKLAVTEDVPREGLAEELVRRLADDVLAPRTICHVLFDAEGDAWRLLKERLGDWLAEEPSRAVTGLSVYAQDVMGGPISDEHVAWTVEATGTTQQPRFTARVALRLGSLGHESPGRTAASKKDARSHAALTLVCALAGIADRSRDDVELPEPPSPAARARQVPADRHPVMAVNEYAQLGVISGLTFDYERDGTPHEPVFTCTASAVLAGSGLPMSGTGTAGAKQAAKTTAAADLRKRIKA
ncbi:RNB domain-containing ribonuclease [Phytomonospora sp. NPDC050363]|uniref:RNB domain-containing ribonuclease n=1 Tax=Phytomonospora sp. NPDC050363 TaxID=3155642 RepID=UPI003411F3C1